VDIQFSVAERRAAFRALHECGCFVIPNPWDVGSARWLQALGFQAIASTSAGLAFSLGLPDSSRAVTMDTVLRHLTALTANVNLPLNADFESGYADDPDALAQNVLRCVDTGVAGLSIEDATGDKARPLYDLDFAIARIRAARAAIDSTGTGVLLTARAECYLVGHEDPLKESLRRLTAYAEAGADVLYAPGPRGRQDIQAIVDAVSPKPVNVLMAAHTGLRVADLEELGVRRISTGSSLARAAWTGFVHASKAIAEEGSFEGFQGTTPYADLNQFFTRFSVDLR
jgi:2-methylisocitrate lyase-like PEP mutase family enzyme